MAHKVSLLHISLLKQNLANTISGDMFSYARKKRPSSLTGLRRKRPHAAVLPLRLFQAFDAFWLSHWQCWQENTFSIFSLFLHSLPSFPYRKLGHTPSDTCLFLLSLRSSRGFLTFSTRVAVEPSVRCPLNSASIYVSTVENSEVNLTSCSDHARTDAHWLKHPDAMLVDL